MPLLRAGRLTPVIVSLALACGGVGCGHTAHVGSHRTLRIALSEYRLKPQNVRATAGTLTILVHNYGRLTHNLAVSMDGQSAGATRPIAPGQSGTLTVALTPGNYRMTSTLFSDEALGQYGTLTITS